MIKIGSVVKLLDHSYYVDLQQDGVLKHLHRVGGYHFEHKLQVVAIGCTFPILTYAGDRLEHAGPDGISNDTLVFDKTLGMYFFTQARFLKEVCPNCGR